MSPLLRRTLLTIRSQPSSRKLGRESTFQGGASIVLISHKKIFQRDHFRAIMVDLEPTVVDEVGLEYKTCFQNFTFSCVTTFSSVAGENWYLSSHFHFHTFRWELVLIANSSTQASWSLGRRWPHYISATIWLFFVQVLIIGPHFDYSATFWLFVHILSRTLPTTTQGATTLWERSRLRCLLSLFLFLITGPQLHWFK